jgi:transcriptional regulator of nitric oxide reductase
MISRKVESQIIEELVSLPKEDQGRIIKEVQDEEEVKIVSKSSIDYIIQGFNVVKATKLLAEKVSSFYDS